jgi:hypothetical protein
MNICIYKNQQKSVLDGTVALTKQVYIYIHIHLYTYMYIYHGYKHVYVYS